MKDFLGMGPPVYWVINAGLNYSDPNLQKILCGAQGCDSNSISTQLFIASKYTDM